MTDREIRILQIFMKEVGKRPHLPDAEQRKLAKVCQAGVRAKLRREAILKKRAVTPQEEVRFDAAIGAGIAAAKTLTESNLRLAIASARRKGRPNVAFLDSIQAAALGLHLCASKYDPKNKAKFVTYAQWWQQYSLMELASDHTPLSMPRHFIHGIYDIAGAEREFADEFGRDATDAELAAYATERRKRRIKKKFRRESTDKYTPDIARHLRALASMTFVSAQTAFGPDGDDMQEVLMREETTPEELTGRMRIIEDMRRAIAEFKEVIAATSADYARARNIAVFERIATPDREDKTTLEELGQLYHVSRERIRQIETELRAQFKAFLLKRMPDAAREAMAA